MGKKDSFNVGDLVFAKVKGYPAWPAKIVDITKSKKYSVYFYGTGERANVVGKDISLYVNTKQKLATNSAMKRADFRAAVEQIDAALEGDDPAPNSYEIPLDKSNATFDNTLNSTLNASSALANSTKIDDSIAEDSGNGNGEADAESDSKDDVADIAQEDETVSEPVDESPETTKTEAVEAEPENQTPAVEKAEPKPATPKPEVNPEVKPEAKIEAKTEPKSDGKAEISRSGRVIKRTKYLVDEAPAQVPTKRKRPSESQTPVSKIAKKADESGAVDETGKYFTQTAIRNEVTLLQFDVEIKSSLQLISADTSRCIAVLEKFKNLEVTPLMLKKNPQAAETIKRLRRYVGNTKEWNFSEEQHLEFNEKAAKIRKLAEQIYNNFKKLFTFPSRVPFWQGFMDEVESFKEQTKSLTHEELITLTDDLQSAANANIENKNSIRV